jgi:hypothetical protein
MKVFYLLFLFSITSYGQLTDKEGYGTGAPERTTYANSFYGSGTTTKLDVEISWDLAGRKLVGKPKNIHDCNETGKVVVKILVNKQGNITKLEYTKIGSSTDDVCLIQAALKTAKSFKWQSDSKAPETQIGYVVVNFTVGE